MSLKINCIQMCYFINAVIDDLNLIKSKSIMKNLINLSIIILAALTIESACLHMKLQPGIGEQDVFLQDSYNYFVTKDGNVVWAGALSLAWHELTENIIKQDVKLNTQNQLALKIVNSYNTCPFKRGDLEESSYYIKSGYGQKTVIQINTEVKKKFPKKNFNDIDAVLKDTDIISYAYLAKNFQYPVKFKLNQNFKFKNSTVKSFKATSDEHRDQVNYLYYQNQNEFMIKLKTKKDNEGVYLLRTDYTDASVSDIVSQVKKWQNQPLRQLGDSDRFEMPVVDLDYTREVPQIQNIQLANQKFRNYVFQTVYEGVKLKIDERGVKVENEGVIISKTTATLYPPKPKYFILNETFWVILKEQGKHPYMVIKINDPKQKGQF